MATKSKKEPKEQIPKPDVNQFAGQFFKSNKNYHLNFEESIDDGLVSSGSMILDSHIGGGFDSGLLRFCGGNECGKTSEALQVLFEHLKKDSHRGLYIKAEGRLSNKMQERSGVNFVYSPEEWVDGTCLVFECNVYDVVFDFVRGIMKNNPSKSRFCIIFDSMDGLIPQGDLDKNTSEAAKVAAGALLSSDFLKRVSLGMSKFGHVCIMISQVRATIKGQYEGADPNNQTNSSGSNALLHYPSWILEFQRQFSKDKILENPSAQLSDTNRAIGHYVKVKIAKSTNESSGIVVKYPVKYGRTGGRSVWIEREIVDLLLSWEFINKKGAWFSLEEELAEYIKNGEFEFPEKIQGINNIYSELESNEKLTQHLRKFVEENILNA